MEATLASCQNFFKARLKVFLTLRPQPHPGDRQSFFDPANPVEKFFYVLAGLFIIVVQIFRSRHGFKKKFFLRAFRGCTANLPDAEQACVSGEEMLEAEIYFQMAVLTPGSAVEILSITNKLQGLRLHLPSRRIAFVNPQIPARMNRVRAIVIQMILRQFHDACGIQRKRTQILLVDRSFRPVHRANFEMCESGLLRREGNRGKKSAQSFQKEILRKILAPDTQVSLIRHAEHYTGMQLGAEIEAAGAQAV